MYCFIPIIVECNSTKYGPDCKLTCGECKNGLCDHETGQCLEGCNPGWKGALCNTSKTHKFLLCDLFLDRSCIQII